MDEELKNLLISQITNAKIASLGTTLNDQPFVSMVSFSVKEDFSEFYILLSKLAKHSKNILENNKICIMICQPETELSNPQTLARISISGTAKIIERKSEDYIYVKNNYLAKNIYSKMFFGLGDFQLYSIEIENVRFVAGFAKTFNLTKGSLQNLTKH